MSQLILDEQLNAASVLLPIQKWIKAEQVHNLRPDQNVLDDRVPAILRTLKEPTFVTIDRHFWRRRWCNPKYCILYFAVRQDQQALLPGLLRELLRQPEFRTRAGRMGILARITTTRIEYWQFRSQRLQRIEWPARRRRQG